MISYYSSKHPGLFLYLVLIVGTVFSLLFLETTALHIGLLSLLWGFYVLMRALSFFELNEYISRSAETKTASKNTNDKSSALAYDLTKNMKQKSHMKRGFFAMNAMHERTMLWFALAFAYVVYSLYTNQSVVSTDITLQNISIFFIIGAAFWAGQTYAYSDQASQILILTCCALLGIAFFTITQQGSGYIRDPLTLEHVIYFRSTSTPLLAALIAYSSAILLYSCSYGKTYSINAITGLMLVILLVLCGLTFQPSAQNSAFWVAGWSLFSIFWIRSYCQKKKRYTLYQCE